ncbi:MAG: cyclodeaminase/cyclohydrolase family protein [Planctomycetia bacterium]|nr:cyclodeaminase/cyclohydrolase family protein [Planctomycetia bacterium]
MNQTSAEFDLSSRPTLAELPIKDFLAALAARTPTPGGGSMTALTAALAAGQLRMVIAYTRGKPRFAAVDNILADYEARLTRAGAVLCELMEEDRVAYEALNPLLKLPPTQRRADPAFPAAVAAAIRIPQAVAAAAGSIVEAAVVLRDKVNPRLLSDLGVAAITAMAAVMAAELNVLVNLPLLDNPVAARALALEIAHQSAQARTQWDQLAAQLHRGLSATIPATAP